MQIYYWSPFLTNIATINAVKRSAISLRKYFKKNFKVSIINSCGEWSFLKNNNYAIELVNHLNFNLHKFLPKEGFFKSRISFIVIFILNIFPLLINIKKNKPDYLVIHLLTLLPILLSPFLYKNTKIILRISGLPELTSFRKFIWKNFAKYIYMVTTPTKLTAEDLINNQIFKSTKIKILRDPIINCEEIVKAKKEKLDKNIIDNDYYISIGRLTGQKNFSFLINFFSRNVDKLKIKKLYIIGEGEEYSSLKELILKNKMQNNIFLLGFKKNIYNYLYFSSGLISSASYEDPGFTLIEAAFLKKNIISSLVKNGPKEMSLEGNVGFFYKYNDEDDLLKKIKECENSNDKIKNLNAIKLSKKYSIFNHSKQLAEYLI